jgi:Leucine-rich repeat (LRR) protein
MLVRFVFLSCLNSTFNTCVTCSELGFLYHLNTAIEFHYHTYYQNINLTICSVFKTQMYKKIEAIYMTKEISQWLEVNSTDMENLHVSFLRLLICGRLTTLPKVLGNLTSLTTLGLFECWRLTTLPEGLGNLTSLTTLDLSVC